MKYAKLIDGQIVFAPRHITVGEYTVYNPTHEMLTAEGYKPVRYADPPEVEPGYVAVPGWDETAEEIVQTWTVEPEPDEVDAERAMEILFGGDPDG